MNKKIVNLGLISVILMPATAVACNNNSNENKSNLKSDNSIIYTPKKIAGIMPIYDEDDLNWYDNNRFDNISKFIDSKGEAYFTKYREYLYKKYAKKESTGLTLGSKNVFEDKYLITSKFYKSNDKFKGKSIVIEFREFFDWAREDAWKEHQKSYGNTKKDYLKNINDWKYKNESQILKAIYG